jgi:FAD/FMN-containing dehydrogenase
VEFDHADRRPADTVRALRAIVGNDHVFVDDDQRAGYETDWTGRYTGRCVAVVRPASTAEISALLRHCNEHAISVIPQAGNTGLVGASVPRPDGTSIVLSMRRMDNIGDVDVAAMQVTVGAGVTIGDWQRAARASDLDTPIDFAARESATVGGAVATNAGGSRVVRFGTMRQQVMGIEAVLADGSVVGSLGGLPKETVGLHWPSILTGSEGTLAVVTAARLRLVPRFERVTTAFIALDDLAAACGLLRSLRRNAPSLDSIEIMFGAAVDLVARHLDVRTPVEVPAEGVALLVECAGHSDPTGDLLAVLGSADGIAGTAIAEDESRRRQLVAFRDRLTEAIGAASTEGGTPTYKLDVAVPISALDRIVDIAQQVADRQGARLIAFGHLAEGNLHLNFLDATRPDDIAERVLADVASAGGTISAEHGVGIAKNRWLPLVRSAEDLEAQRSIKRAMDPLGIMNPGVLEPPPRNAQVP